MGTITERSFGAPEAVISGQYGIGVVIDFFGLSAIAAGQPVDFVYPSLTAVVPASIAKVKPRGARLRSARRGLAACVCLLQQQFDPRDADAARSGLCGRRAERAGSSRWCT